MEKTKINQLKQITVDDSLPAELRESAKEQLRALGEVIPEPVPVQEPAPEKPKSFVGIFDQYILADSAAEERERIAMLDKTKRTCSACYLTASVESESCELCGKVPDRWLLPSSLDSEQSMFSKMAAGHSVAQLKTALSSPWASAPGREDYARKLLPLKEAAERQAQHQAEASTIKKASAEESPVLVTDRQVRAAKEYLEIEAEKVRLEIEKMKENK